MEEKLKGKKLILFFTYGVSLGTWKRAGTLQRDIALYKKLQQQGLGVTFVTYGGAEDITLAQENGIDVIANTSGWPRVFYFLLLPFIVRRAVVRADIVKSHQFIGTLPALIIAKLFHVPYIARGGYLPTVFFEKYHKEFLSIGWWKRAAATLDEWLVCRFADAIVVPSIEETKYLGTRHSSMAARMEVIPNWIDTEKFKPLPDVPKKPRSILFVGRFEEQKNPLLFLEALINLENVTATMIGTGSMYEKICLYVREHKLRVTVVKDRIPNKQLPAIYNEYEVYVLPSSFEGGSPKTLLEAMACGLPVVAADEFGARNIIENENIGTLCKLESGDLAKQVQRYLDNPELRIAHAKNAREYVEKNYSLQVILDKEIKLLTDLLTG